MPFTISDETLVGAGLDERQAAIEFACWLFAAGKITLPLAGRLAGLSRPEFEDELFQRKIPAYTITAEDLEQDLESLRKLGY